MTPQHEIDRFYMACAANEVDLLRARLGIPAPVKFVPKQKAQAPIPSFIDLIERPSFLFGMFVVAVAVMVVNVWGAQ